MSNWENIKKIIGMEKQETMNEETLNQEDKVTSENETQQDSNLEASRCESAGRELDADWPYPHRSGHQSSGRSKQQPRACCCGSASQLVR